MLRYRWVWLLQRLLVRFVLPVAGFMLLGLGVVHANVPGGKPGPRGAVPNPGTQQQELGNITFPAPFNVFEFVATCGACHSGTVDQQTAHFGNWAGTNMASAARDPIFRANAMIVDTALPGAGNMCFRCHSPNGWLSGRFDPTFAGASDGSTMIHSILASTDDEGINCDTCHRAIGNVTMQREDLPANDPAWRMMSGLSDWPHLGTTYADAGNGPLPGNPLGDGTLQFSDGMTYSGKYTGSVEIFKSDLPVQDVNPDGTPKVDAAGNPVYTYTGQTYGVYPPGYPETKKPKFANNNNQPFPAGKPKSNTAVPAQEIVYNPDGSVPIHFEQLIAPPTNGDPQAVSIEHPTAKGDFIRSSEFCGSCHDLTVPVANHGMPEQRTYTEWKYSNFGPEGINASASTSQKNCQSCHDAAMKQEYSDDAAVSLNADPTLVGWAPYGVDRNPQGGTTMHKLAGANRDLAKMMKILYPEVDLEVIGAPTNNDPRIFPGMMSSRDLTWDRTIRNTEISMTDGVDINIDSPPTRISTDPTSPDYNRWQVKVKVTNTSGHSIPSGYPDGRRFWISLDVKDATDTSVYQSGVYDQATAELRTDSATAFNRALSNTIDSTNNAVMVYEKVTGSCGYDLSSQFTCKSSPSLLNGTILFDNRIPPAGFNKAKYMEAGSRFWNYDPTNFVRYDDSVNRDTPSDLNSGRYPNGQGYDIVTYTFSADPNAQLSARAEIKWQTHSREFVEHLKNSDTSTLRPEGPPSLLAANYPLTPTYLSDQVLTYINANNGTAADLTAFSQVTDMDGNALRDNWGGIAYAAWTLTGKGDPFVAASDSTVATAAPVAPANWGTKYNPTNGSVAADLLLPLNPFALDVSWDPATGADGYVVWIRYGKDISPSELGDTASWDKLAVVYPTDNTVRQTFRSEGLNAAKTYQYRIEAFNGKGSTFSGYVVKQTTTDLPLAPDSLKVVTAKPANVTLAWYDLADNEEGFIIERQDVLPNGGLGQFAEVGRTPSNTTGTMGFGANSWTDTSALAGMTYNYQVRAYNFAGISQPSLPVQAAIGTPPTGTIAIQSTIVDPTTAPKVKLTWSGASGTIVGYKVQRGPTNAGPWSNPPIGVAGTPTGTYTDATVAPLTTYFYRVVAYNSAGDGNPAIIQVSVPAAGVPPGTATNLTRVAGSPQIVLIWTAPTGTAPVTGYTIQRVNATNNTWPANGAVTTFTSEGTATTYTDVTAVPGARYLYRVIAFNAAGNGPASTPTTRVNVPAAPPNNLLAFPTNLRLTVATGSIRLNWSDNANNESGYYVERLEGGNWSRISTIVGNNIRTYTDRTTTKGTVYQYRVQAYYTSPAGVTITSDYSNIPAGVTAR